MSTNVKVGSKDVVATFNVVSDSNNCSFNFTAGTVDVSFVDDGGNTDFEAHPTPGGLGVTFKNFTSALGHTVTFDVTMKNKNYVLVFYITVAANAKPTPIRNISFSIREN